MSGFDWDGAYRRLAELGRLLEREKAPPQAEVRRVLRERAAALAAPPRNQAAAPRANLIVFRVGDERFAIDTRQVDEVGAVPALTELPVSSPLHLGLFNYRGLVYPLIDLRPLVGAAAEPRCTGAFFLLVETRGSAIAIAADAVDALHRADESDVAYAAEGEALHSAVLGTVHGTTVLVDAHRIAADARLVINDRPIARSQNEGRSRS